MIPKKIHQVWLGSKKLPDSFLCWRQKLSNLNPSWKIQIWTEENIETLKFFKKPLFEKLSNYSEKSDYIRFLCVLEFGGIYLDTDMEPVKSFKIITKNEKKGIFFGSEWSKNNLVVINGALFGSEKNNKVLKILIQKIEERIKSADKNIPSHAKLGPQFITPILLKMGSKISIFEPEYFNPIPWWLVNKKGKKFITEKTVTIHHYNNSWGGNFLSKNYQKIMNKINKLWGN